MFLALGVVLLVAAAVVIALAIRSSRRPAIEVAAVTPRDAVHDDLATEPAIELQALVEPAEPEAPEPEPPPITWTTELSTSVLDEEARLRLIDDLALVAAPWSIALLRRAEEEEPSPHVRARIEAALATY